MIHVYPEKTTYDPAGQVFYEPFVSDDGRVGYRVGRTDERSDAETFIYLNPNMTLFGEAVVYLYIGTENDPTEDEAEHFYAMDEYAFGLLD